MREDYGNVWFYRLKWAYTLLVVVTLMLPVFYVMYISFNEGGFGAARYDFTLDWYEGIFTDSLMLTALGWTGKLAAVTTLVVVPLGLLAAKHYKSTRFKVPVISLLLASLFVPSDILGSALLVFFKNLNRAMVFIGRIQSGVAVVNGGTYGSEPHMPFGGLRQSGNGWREAGTQALDVYSDLKTVYINHDPTQV